MAIMRPLSIAEEAAVLSALSNPRDRLLVLFGRYTGFRCSEILAVRVGDVWSAGGIKPEISLSRRLLKGGVGVHRGRVRSRTVPLHPELRAALQNEISRRFPAGNPDPEAFLFVSRKGRNRPICRRQAWAILKGAAARTGNADRIGTHTLRKTFARDIFERTGHDLVVTQKALGHTSVATTVAYLTPEREAVEAAILGVVGTGPFGIASGERQANRADVFAAAVSS